MIAYLDVRGAKSLSSRMRANKSSNVVEKILSEIRWIKRFSHDLSFHVETSVLNQCGKRQFCFPPDLKSKAPLGMMGNEITFCTSTWTIKLKLFHHKDLSVLYFNVYWNKFFIKPWWHVSFMVQLKIVAMEKYRIFLSFWFTNCWNVSTLLKGLYIFPVHV